ncbi:hypothetical protein [Pseudomonas sp. BF-R-26]|uniref:hypothetical protein n=1 Tax=Pseudomonas sp. BF-R-26 TaxID=2832398 RepID=UPI001CC1B4A5|nr:hypothetical protein [Pseudomonas sp. BF-R-26]
MHPAIASVTQELELLETAVRTQVPAGNFNIAHSNWSFPGLNVDDIVAAIAEVRNVLAEIGDDVGEKAGAVEAYLPRLQFYRANSVPQIWGNSQAALSSLFMTLGGLKRAAAPLLKSHDVKELANGIRLSGRQLKTVESRINNLTARSESLDSVVREIESAHEAAIQLPEDLETLSDARAQLQQLLSDAEKDRVHILSARDAAETAQQQLIDAASEATEVVKKANLAYSTATSQGLAAAFADRSSRLGVSMWMWVAGLVLSLGLGSYFGKDQLQHLAELITAPNVTGTAIAINFVLSILSVGAPIWFAWLSTKQIGQRFRLSEDYAFKASISKAYEGYRREAHRIDPVLESQLLRSALSRLDEQPLRLVESASYGSPWHELMSSVAVKEAMKSIPGFAAQIAQIAKSALAKTPPVKPSAEIVDLPAANAAVAEKP